MSGTYTDSSVCGGCGKRGGEPHELHIWSLVDDPGNHLVASSMLQEVQYESWDILGIKGQFQAIPMLNICGGLNLVSADGS